MRDRPISACENQESELIIAWNDIYFLDDRSNPRIYSLSKSTILRTTMISRCLRSTMQCNTRTLILIRESALEMTSEKRHVVTIYNGLKTSADFP